MRLQWMIIAVCLLSSCAFVDGLHNQQQNTSEKSDARGVALPSPPPLPGPIDNQDTPTTDAAKQVITPLVQ